LQALHQTLADLQVAPKTGLQTTTTSDALTAVRFTAVAVTTATLANSELATQKTTFKSKL